MSFLEALKTMVDEKDYTPRKYRVGQHICTVLVVPAREAPVEDDIMDCLRWRGALTGGEIQAAIDAMLDVVHTPKQVRTAISGLVRSGVIRRTRRGYTLTRDRDF